MYVFKLFAPAVISSIFMILVSIFTISLNNVFNLVNMFILTVVCAVSYGIILLSIDKEVLVELKELFRVIINKH